MADATEDSRRGERDADSSADVKAVIIMFSALVLMALHFVSGFTFDF